MIYSDCDPDRPTTPESRLRDALEADVARHLSEVRAGFEAAIKKFGPTESDKIAQASLEALQNAYQNLTNLAMNSQQHNPYCYGPRPWFSILSGSAW